MRGYIFMPVNLSRPLLRRSVQTSRAGSIRRHVDRIGARALYEVVPQMIQRRINRGKETHYKSTVGSILGTSTGEIIGLTEIVQGDSRDERIGNSIDLKSLKLHLTIERDQSVQNVPQYRWTRVILLQTKYEVNMTPGILATFLLGNALNDTARQDPDEMSKFKILYDHVFRHWQNSDGTRWVWGDTPESAVRDYKINVFEKRLAKSQLTFATDTGTNGTGKLYLIAFGNQAAQADIVRYNSIVFYKDR